MFVAVFGSLLVSIYGVSSQNPPPECACVPYYQCRPNGTVITDGEGLFTERLGESCQNCECQDIDVCCFLPKEEFTTTRQPSPPDQTTVTVTNHCGHANPDGIGYKSGEESTEAIFGEFPWMAQIFEDGSYRCGGSIIHPSVILTAAHCVKEPESSYTIRAGEWDTSNTNERFPHQNRTIASIKPHEEFNPKNYRHDIALVFLAEPLQLKPHISLACLVPEAGISGDTRCIATGWGTTKHDPKENSSTILKKVDLPLLQNPDCQRALRKTRLGAYFNLHDTFICAGAEKDKDTCTGDGGGPLFCPIEGQEDRYQQVGITAWGLGCNDENVPGVYANVANLRKWIDKEMKEKNFEITPYQYK